MSQFSLNYSSVLEQNFASFDLANHALLAKNTALQTMQNTARKNLLNKGLPSRKHEDWRYFNLKNIVERTYQFQTEEAALSMHTIERIQSLDFCLKAQKVIICDGSQTYIWDPITKQAKKENCFASIQDSKTAIEILAGLPTMDASIEDYQSSFLSQIKFLDINDSVYSQNALVLIYTSSLSKNLNSSRILVKLAKNQNAKITEVFMSDGEESFDYSRLDIVLEENSHINLNRIQEADANSFFMNDLCVVQARNSTSEILQFSLGAKQSRSNIHIDLNDENASCNVQALYTARDRQQMDHNVRIQHNSKNTFSTQNLKGIMDDYAKAIFDGKIFIAKGADGSNAQQSNKNMLLSNSAEVDSKPQLVVRADDVKASHGHSTGKLNPDEMFYLMSRAIEPAKAKEILSQAYAFDVLLSCKFLELQTYFKEQFSRWIAKSKDKI